VSVVDARPATLVAAFQQSAERVPERVALRGIGDAFTLTWAEYGAAVERAAAALAALGVGRGDRVAFLSANRPEMAIAELAAMHLGAAGVALYVSSPPATVEYVLADAEPAVLLVEAALEPPLAGMSHTVAQVRTIGGEGPADLLSVPPAADIDFEAAWHGVAGEDLAALIYTSGTTGRPKGVEWTHAAAAGGIASFDRALGEEDGIRDVSYAPFASLAERFGGHWHSLLRGSTRTVCSTPTELGAALLDARPTRLGGPPQVWQGLKLGLEATVAPGERGALDTALGRVRTAAAGESPSPPSSGEEERLAALRARIGLDRIVLAGSTAAACPPGVHEFYGALGVPFREFYAMTEAGVIASQGVGPADRGTLGGPLDGFELRIAVDGEVLGRSPCAPRRYHRRPEETRATYDADGWIHTGDLGELDGDGRLRLIDRKKEMIVPAHGHNVSPTRIESALRDACPLIAQVCVVGEGRPHLGALIVLGSPVGVEDDDARAAVAAAISALNAEADPRERIEAHAILVDPWLPGVELTETLKPRRAQIAARHAEAIEGMYTSSSPDPHPRSH
jgi:long-chain acyl-CoA synthetase